MKTNIKILKNKFRKNKTRIRLPAQKKESEEDSVQFWFCWSCRDFRHSLGLCRSRSLSGQVPGGPGPCCSRSLGVQVPGGPGPWGSWSLAVLGGRCGSTWDNAWNTSHVTAVTAAQQFQTSLSESRNRFIQTGTSFTSEPDLNTHPDCVCVCVSW